MDPLPRVLQASKICKAIGFCHGCCREGVGRVGVRRSDGRPLLWLVREGRWGPGPGGQRSSTLVSLLPAPLLVLHDLGTVQKEDRH